jgi:hypothetical protein
LIPTVSIATAAPPRFADELLLLREAIARECMVDVRFILADSLRHKT